jgi:hypothetical protein
MYNELHDVYEEAVKDHATTNLDSNEYDARMSHGIKIVRTHEDNSIQIFNTARGGDYYKELEEDEYNLLGGDYYKELEEDEYNLFFEFGWVVGVCKMALIKYKERLDVIETKIKDEINGRNNSKYISFLKETRKNTLNKYYKITQKLNQHEN